MCVTITKPSKRPVSFHCFYYGSCLLVLFYPGVPEKSGEMHGRLSLLFIICQRNEYTVQRPVCELFQAVHRTSCTNLQQVL